MSSARSTLAVVPCHLIHTLRFLHEVYNITLRCTAVIPTPFGYHSDTIICNLLLILLLYYNINSTYLLHPRTGASNHIILIAVRFGETAGSQHVPGATAATATAALCTIVNNSSQRHQPLPRLLTTNTNQAIHIDTATAENEIFDTPSKNLLPLSDTP